MDEKVVFSYVCMTVYTVAFQITQILGLLLPLLIAVAYLTLAERKIMGAMQRRKGPDVVGLWGLFQPLADALKLLVKEAALPTLSDIHLFVAAPILTFIFAMMGWAALPLSEDAVLVDLDLGILYIFATGSLGVYGIIIAGWASNSKYAFLGALRSTAQMVSYEVSIGLILISVLLCTGSLQIASIVKAQEEIWLVLPLFPIALLFFISCLAETNRAPFDLPEAEAELVAGYNVEYSSMGFALFFLGEYANMMVMSSLCFIFFLGGWLPPLDLALFHWIPGGMWFGLKVVCILFVYIWVRACYPRYRYDQLMGLGWKVFLPLSLAWVVFVAGILISFDWLPIGAIFV